MNARPAADPREYTEPRQAAARTLARCVADRDRTPRSRFACKRLLAACLAGALAACSSAPVQRSGPSTVAARAPLRIVDVPAIDPIRANDVLIRAIGLVGTPYRWGGNTPEGGFDCSGLVNYVYRDMAALNLPRTSGGIAGLAVPKVRGLHLASGDLLFFAPGGKVSHIGIYVGEGRFVHAPTSGGTVRLDKIDSPYWRDNYAGATRPLR